MRYTKMHGAGNSFLILECLRGEQKGEDLRDLALRLCSPHSGPGADGMIVILPASEDADFAMLFYNSDGSVGEMCGNGARCVARYAVEHGLSPDPENIRFRATAGMITARRIDQTRYEVRLPDPSVMDLLRSTGEGFCSYGVVPLENSTAGSVTQVFDLMMKHKFHIVTHRAAQFVPTKKRAAP